MTHCLLIHKAPLNNPPAFPCLCSRSQAAKWCDDGIYLLASQPVDRCQSHEGAEAALLELERYLEAAGQNLLTDRATICTQYEAVLNQEFMVQIPSRVLTRRILTVLQNTLQG